MNRKVFFPAVLALAIFTVGILATKVSAQNSSNYPPIVEKIAARFNLNVADVQKVFDEQHEEKRADMYAHFAERLNDLVAEGKITESQKDSLLDKHEEMLNSMEEFKDLSPEDRRTKMTEIHENFKSWAEEEGLDLSQIGPFGFKFKGHGFGGKHNFLMRLD